MKMEGSGAGGRARRHPQRCQQTHNEMQQRNATERAQGRLLSGVCGHITDTTLHHHSYAQEMGVEEGGRGATHHNRRLVPLRYRQLHHLLQHRRVCCWQAAHATSRLNAFRMRCKQIPAGIHREAGGDGVRLKWRHLLLQDVGLWVRRGRGGPRAATHNTLLKTGRRRRRERRHTLKSNAVRGGTDDIADVTPAASDAALPLPPPRRRVRLRRRGAVPHTATLQVVWGVGPAGPGPFLPSRRNLAGCSCAAPL